MSILKSRGFVWLLFIPIAIGMGSISFHQSFTGQDCSDEKLAHFHAQINQLIAANTPNKALSYLDSLESLAREHSLYPCSSYWATRVDLTEAYELNNQFDIALSKYHEIIRSARDLGFPAIEAEAFLSIARIHETIGRPVDCKRNLENALDIINKFRLQSTRSRYAVRNASYHRIYESRDSAAFYARMAIALGKEYKIHRSEMDGYLLLGMVSQELDSIIFYFEASVQLYLQQKNYIGAASQTLNISSSLIDHERYDNALDACKTALVYLGKVKEQTQEYHYFLSNAYEDILQVYKSKQLTDSVYHYQSLAYEHKIMANRMTNQEKINEIEIENALQQELIKTQFYKNRNRTMNFLIIFGLVGMVIMLSMYFNIVKNRRQIKKQHEIIARNNVQLEEALHKRTMLLSEIHHRVKNNLQVIISLLLLKSEFSKEKDTKNFLNDLSTQVKGIALIHDQLYQSDEFDQINLGEYVQKLFENFNFILSEEHKFAYAIDISEIFINLETCLPLGIICTELINNSLKYARADGKILELSISVKKSGKDFLLTFKDNGSGFPDKSRTKRGLGTLLMNNMVRQLKGKINFYSHDGALTELTFAEKNTSKL